MKLFWRFFIPVAISLTLTVIVISATSIYSENKSIINQSHERLESNITIVESSLNGFINTYFSLAETLAKDNQIEAFMSDYNVEDQEALEYVYNKLEETYEACYFLNNVLLVPSTGILQIDAKRSIWENPHDHRENAYFIWFEEHPNLLQYILSPKEALVNQKPIFDLAYRVQSGGENLGFIILPINVSLLMDEFIYSNLHDRDVVVLIADNKGQIYGSRNRDYIFNETYTLTNSEPEFFDLITSQKSGITEGAILGTKAMVAYKYFEPMDSYIIAYKDISMRQNLQFRAIATSIMSALGLMLVGGGLIFFFTRKVVQPINQLSSYAGEVSKGFFDIEINQGEQVRNDEIGNLTNAFKTMIKEINKQFIEQEEARQALSHKNIELQESKNELIQRFEEINKQKSYIDYLANYDVLTTLPNRSFFIDQLEEALTSHKEGAVLLMDLDNFKSMNDTLGHLFGDYLLESIAGSFKTMVNNRLMVARMGGDEFGILLTSPELIASTLQSLKENFKQSFTIEGTEVEATFSVGVALFPDDSINKDELISYADIALYSAKNSGKNNAKFFDSDMENSVLNKHSIENTLKTAIAEDGFTIYYQPQVNIVTGEIMSYEALLRLKSMAYGPGEFISVAEETGQIIEIGQWVTKKVIAQIHEWESQGYNVKPISINFSAYQLYDPDYINVLQEAMATYDVVPEMLEIEITESIYMANEEKTTEFLKQLQDLRIKISIDDFGTGYSALNYLTYMPLSKLKIDRLLSVKFLQGTDISVIKSIIGLAHSLKLIVVAEGIEDGDFITKLKGAGCDLVQGYYYSKPLEGELVPETFSKIYD